MMLRYFTISHSTSTVHSASTYVPIVLVSRVLTFLRVLLVARILGNAGQQEFGLYQLPIELINFFVPLVMLGLADVAERYASHFEKHDQLLPAIRRHLRRLGLIGLAVITLLLATAPWLTYPLFKLPNDEHSQAYSVGLLAACAFAIVLLAFYQYLAALLRGLRAFAPAAGLELAFAALFVIFSSLAAFQGSALALVIAYALALLLPTLYFALILRNHLKSHPVTSSPYHPATLSPCHTSFATWTLLRLQLTMSFGAIMIWSVGQLAIAADLNPQVQTADYASASRIAQQLALIAVTLWASCYGIAARSWSHHQTRRAKVQFLRVGKFGAMLLTLLALIILDARDLFAFIFPSVYSEAINELLPPLLCLYLWYGLLAFASTFSNLQEQPRKGTALWAIAIAVQLAMLFVPAFHIFDDPKLQVIFASTAGLGVALLVFTPLFLRRPPLILAILALAPLSLLTPPGHVDLFASIVLLLAMILSVFLLRPFENLAIRRFLQARKRK
ncbi:MAG: hypothetical protein FWD53_03365 [Phycisphaerales bacterium]|nr:hypothetical protein [Phycisphaerales bacterium]